ncbi:hypothetical protein VU07_05180 [Desulfobulbus sp. F4]|nr:hypothetical protein [Desulfobulbus sp. F4]
METAAYSAQVLLSMMVVLFKQTVQMPKPLLAALQTSAACLDAFMVSLRFSAMKFSAA